MSVAGVPVEEYEIDVNDFKQWLDSYPEIQKYYGTMGDVYIEKCLEHYISYRFLGLSRDDIYIDIASLGSPWAGVLERRTGTKSYRLDLIFPAGLRGRNIGANAGDTKLPDGFASALSAQCAYECFMGDADVSFVKEANRILRDNGRFAILPLYVDQSYYVMTSPYCDQQEVQVDDGARRVWRDDVYKVPFSRHYSPESFNNSIYSALSPAMKGKIAYFKNLPDVMKQFPGQRVYCYFMFYAEKSR